MFSLPKIPRIQKPLVSSAVVDQSELLVKEEARQVFHGNGILFVGDNSMRTLYRDMAKLLDNGKILSDGDASAQHGEYKKTTGEIRIRNSGSQGMPDYIDFRAWISPNMTLLYDHFGTLYGSEPEQLFDWLHSVDTYPPITMVVMSSARSDMSLRQIDKSSLPFDTQLDNYRSKLDYVLGQLVSTARKPPNVSPIFVWISSTPPPGDISVETLDRFLKILTVGNELSAKHGFYHLKRLLPWLTNVPQLVVAKTGNFSAKGARIVSESLCELAATIWQEDLLALAPLPSVPSSI